MLKMEDHVVAAEYTNPEHTVIKYTTRNEGVHYCSKDSNPSFFVAIQRMAVIPNYSDGGSLRVSAPATPALPIRKPDALVIPPPLPHLGNGELVSCDFRIKDGVPAGTVALEIESPFLGDAEGGEIPVRVRNGSVRIIAELPTNTPTATSTPMPTNTPTRTSTATNTVPPTATATVTNTSSTPATATATATNTRSTPATATATATSTPSTPSTPTATATATRTGATPTATKKKSSGGGGCNVVPTDPSGTPGATALLLLPAALLLWARRREQ